MNRLTHGCIEYRPPPAAACGEWTYWGRIGPLEDHPGMGLRPPRDPGPLRGIGPPRPPAASPPRGLPPDATPGTLHEYCLEVRPDGGLDDRAITPAQVAEWTRQGGVEWYDKSRRLLLDDRWRAPTWMTPEEFAARLPHGGGGGGGGGGPGPYELVLTVLDQLAGRGGEARVVIWGEGR